MHVPNIESSINHLKTILEKHQNLLFSNDVERYLSELRLLKKNYQINIEAAQQEGRNLKIAVVGQMKAGKSSFLNALLFPIDVLPKAATPMTAALTRLAYAEQPYAEIEFYSIQDWNGIEQSAHAYQAQYEKIEQELITEQQEQAPKSLFGQMRKLSSSLKPQVQASSLLIESKISPELRSSHELVQMANNLNLREYLGTKKRIYAESLEDLAQQLKNYVGSQGEYTAITKMFSIYIDDKRLQGIEVYDTPGFNDPVISRGQQTREFLGQCDVVFLLSIINQFLTVADLKLLREQLTSAGIDNKAVYLIGSQRDLVFRMDRDILIKAQLMAQKYPIEVRSQATIAAMMQLLDLKVQQMAEAQISQHLNNPDLDPASKALLNVINQTKPELISALSWRIAEGLPELNLELQEQYDALCQDTQFTFEAKQLREFSNLQKLHVLLGQQKLRKHELLQAKLENLENALIQRVGAIRVELGKHIEQKIELLEKNSIESLLKQKQATEYHLQRGKSKIDLVINDESLNIKNKLNVLIQQLKVEQYQFLNIETLEEKRVEFEKFKKEGFWAEIAREFGLGGYGHREKIIVTPYARVQDSIEQLELFAQNSVAALQMQLTEIVDISTIRKNVTLAAINLFDTSDPDFDLDFFKVQVSECLSQFTPPKLEIDIDKITDRLVSNFGLGHVTNEQIHLLKKAHKNAVQQLSEHIMQLAEGIQQDIQEYFDDLQQILVNRIINEIQQNLDSMMFDIQQKEASIKGLNLFKSQLFEFG
ncbi:dynamin family protein [Acinetobacter sp. PW68]|uniref:dynamin family protein n=1 Tax=Acinetobacter sp. PW68 TaxID=2865162 RepID=UPI001E37B79E|nr:dynamin family protein [Acinetobacter sp. PW68]MCD0187789.1 dynamin family protein [Acinetobacter sp. PW68]